MTLNEFLRYSQQAWDMVEQSDQRAPLRYGQALWNILPENITNQIYMSDKDFFYWKDERFTEINQICYNLCSDYKEEK